MLETKSSAKALIIIRRRHFPSQALGDLGFEIFTNSGGMRGVLFGRGWKDRGTLFVRGLFLKMTFQGRFKPNSSDGLGVPVGSSTFLENLESC